jgi:peptide/nickel transport system substrate-binding protein
MREIEALEVEHALGRLSRRDFLGRALALGLGVDAAQASLARAEELAEATPRSGGTLRLGLGGGSTTDTLNPLSWTDSVMIDVGFGLYNSLVENSADNRPVPELAESYDANDDATVWTFALRRGVHFHNGKLFDAQDAVYSLNLHRRPLPTGAAGFLSGVTDIKILGKTKIEITLASGNADFPTVLTDYHIKMVPDGFEDWANPVGTGAFRVERFAPGSRIVLAKAGRYWKENRGYLDAVDVTVINETGARMDALIGGAVDVINRTDPRTVSRIDRSPTLAIVRASGGWYPVMGMQIDVPPFNNPDLRRALQFALDREQMIKVLFNGYGTLGNDNPIPHGDPYFNAELPQLRYDPDKARALFRQAGLTDPRIVLQTSEAAFNRALDMARLFQTTAGRAGIPIEVQERSADGYFDKVWLKDAFVASYWGGRPSATQMLEVAYASNAAWNESHWRDPHFDALLTKAKAELDDDKRRKMIFELQAMLTNAGGTLIPCFRDWLDARHRKVGGHTPHGGFDMDNGRIAEKAFLKA